MKTVMIIGLLVFAMTAYSGENQELPSVYTVEQIQTALQEQFKANAWNNPQVISVQRVVRETDGYWWESAGEYVDLSNASRYKVTVRYEESLEEYNKVSQLFNESPFVRDGDYTVYTGYYHFNDENGTPVLPHVMC